MKCPHCGMIVESGEKQCPYCFESLIGANINNMVQGNSHDEETDYTKTVTTLEADESEAPVETTVPAEEAEAPEAEAPEAEAPAEPIPFDPNHTPRSKLAPPKKKKNKLPLIICAGVLIVALLIYFAPSSLFHKVPDSADIVVANYNEHTLTNRQFNYYFYSDYYYYLDNYYYDLPFDEEVALDEQQFSENLTWEDYFVESSIGNWRDIMAVGDLARAAGYEMGDDYKAALDELETDLTNAAIGLGLKTAEEYLIYIYGSASDYESFYEFLETNYLATSYSDDIYLDLYTTYSTFTSTPSMNVRHILVSTDNYDDPKATADEIYATFLAGDKSEASFGELAEEYSEDPGSNTNGGFYDNVVPGEMVDAFDEWCFAKGRKQGDSGIVETDFGYHVMLHCGAGETQEVADETVALEKYYEWLDEAAEAHTLDIIYNSLEIY